MNSLNYLLFFFEGKLFLPRVLSYRLSGRLSHFCAQFCSPQFAFSYLLGRRRRKFILMDIPLHKHHKRTKLSQNQPSQNASPQSQLQPPQQFVFSRQFLSQCTARITIRVKATRSRWLSTETDTKCERQSQERRLNRMDCTFKESEPTIRDHDQHRTI